MTLEIHIAASDISHKNGWDTHFNGWVCSPAYAWWSRQIWHIESTWPCIVDNGAWSDQKKEDTPGARQIFDRTLKTIDLISNEIKFAVLPDKVGDWFESVRMMNEILDDDLLSFDVHQGTEFQRSSTHPWAVVISEGWCDKQLLGLLEKVTTATKLTPWIFIGGQTFEFKKNSAKILEHFFPQFPVHVGKVHKLRELVHFYNCPNVYSVDTSTFSRPPTAAYQKTLTQRLDQFKAWRDGDQTVLTDWMDV